MSVTKGITETVNFNFIWKIENFSSLTPKTVGTVISSPRYKIKNTEWTLDLYPYGYSEETKDNIELFLRSTTCEESQTNDIEIKVTSQFSILNRFEQKVFSVPNKMSYDKYEVYTKKAYSFGYDDYISKDILLNEKDLYLFNNKLMILCEICMNPQENEIIIINQNKNIQMFEDFESLFLKQCFTDLTIIVDDKKLFVHKSILSARSKVFRAMLKHDMKENNESLVKITDTSYDVMKEVLRFIYCGSVENLEKLAISILPMADKYELSSLKLICEDVLWKTLNIENACETLAVIETHNCNNLKSKIIKYIITNIKQVTLTPGFKELKYSKSHLLEDMLQEVAQTVS